MYFSTGVCKCKYSLIYLDEIPMSKYTTLVKKKKRKSLTVRGFGLSRLTLFQKLRSVDDGVSF